jgi:phosphoserine phosphatase
MGGDVKFEVALEARLNLISPSRKAIDDCLAVHPPVLTPGVADLVAALQHDGKDVYLVSGGFRLVCFLHFLLGNVTIL